MRIAIFSDNFYPEIDGISDSVITLTKNLTKLGHFVNFYVPYYSQADFKKTGMPRKELDLGKNVSVVRFFSLPYPTGTGQGRLVIPTCLRWLKVKEFAPDVIHSQLFFGVGFEALIAAHILKKPLVGTNHTALKEFLRYSPIRAPWFTNLILRYINWYYEHCDLVTAPSQSVFDEMVSLGFENKNTKVISNPIDTNTFRPLADKIGLKKKFGFNDTTIIHAGRLADERNPDILIRALPLIKKKVPNAILAFAGIGISEGKLKKLADSLGVGGSVRFLGFLDKPTLAEAYNASEIFAIASTADTQSLVMMQAMAAGLPVIGVRARALPEYVNEKNGFIVEPNDEKAMAEKIVYLLEHKDVAKKLGKGGRIYSEQFSESAIATEWEKIYRNVIKSYNEK